VRGWARRRQLFQHDKPTTSQQLQFVHDFDLGYTERRLQFVIAQNDTLSKRHGEAGVRALFAQMTIPITVDSIVGYVAMTGKTVNLPDVRHLGPRLPFRHNADWDQRHQYDTRAVLAVPLTDPDGQVLGVLQLLNCQSPAGAPIPFPRQQEALIQSMAAHAAIALRYHLLKNPTSMGTQPESPAPSAQ